MPDQEDSSTAASPSKKKHRGRLIGAVIVVALIIIIVASNSGSSSKTSASSATTKPSATTKSSGKTGSGSSSSAATTAVHKPTTTTSPKSWYDSKFGSFAPIMASGTSDSVIKLPSGTKAGIITAKYTGSDDFIITGLDSNNQQTPDLPVDTMGSYSGVTAFGLEQLGSAPTQLKVTATGSWSVTIAPISSAPIAVPKSGTGDLVFLYNGRAANWNLGFKGSGDFIVSQFSSAIMPNLAVDEMGNYSGTVPMDPGPSVVQVEADGSWTIS